MSRFFRVSTDAEDTFVAGLSMGGYGALSWALSHPDRFAAAASLSGARRSWRGLADPAATEDPRMFERIFGAEPIPARPTCSRCSSRRPGDRRRRSISAAAPRTLLDRTTAIRRRRPSRAGLALTTSFVPGVHEWGLWDAEIQRVLDWLPLRTN